MAGNPANTYKFGLDSCYVAPLSVSGDVYTYSVPVAAPGAIEFEATGEGGNEPFEADNGNFVMIDKNAGYKIKLKMVHLTETVAAVISPDTSDSKGVVFEKAGVNYPRFALLGQAKGNVHNVRFTYFDCVLASRPTVVHKSTKVGEPDTVDLELLCTPRSDNRYTRAYTKADTDATVYSGWFTTVQQYVSGT